MDFDKICRLCITPGMNMNYPMNIFNESEFNRNVAKAMHEHIGQVCQPMNHALPKPPAPSWAAANQLSSYANINKQAMHSKHPTLPPPAPPPIVPNHRPPPPVTNHRPPQPAPNHRPPPAATNQRPRTELCEFCSKPFSTRNDVLSHIQKVHTKSNDSREKFQCTICSAWLASRHTLKTHMLNHTSEPRKCPHCDKISPTRNALTTHIRGVHTERTHKCHLCEKSFKAATALKDHVATHTGEKSYKCSYCPEAFIWRPNMYSHQKRAHPTEWSESKRQKEASTYNHK